MEDENEYANMKTTFNNKLNEIIKAKGVNHQIFNPLSYATMISKVEHAKGLKFGKTPADYARLKKYDILEIDGVKRLVVPFFSSTTSSGNKTSSAIRMFVHTDEIFDILHTAHLKSGHKSRQGMTQEVSQFKNITREMIMIYLGLCEVCQEKVAKFHEREIKKSYIDFISMSADQHGYNLILVYLDVKTQFVQLRPLKNTELQEVTQSLLDIFTIFGPPDLLQGNTEDRDQLLVECTIRVTEILNAWVEANKTMEWSEGVKYVQYMKNRDFNPTLNRSAGEALLGHKFGRSGTRKRSLDQALSDKEEESDAQEAMNSGIDKQDVPIKQYAPKRIKLEQVDNSEVPHLIVSNIKTNDEDEPENILS
ncbi:KRAB-A domain-containing protein 2-like [Ostrinia furnacalis]|uniref:KRAB-A domain-containing protein 2-like n=1 Tax=Ostrinia furnacalis TaxID=93504 RepID=UPI00103CE3DA|nr:KRAB-A domain-containing protein 2-like [Ostrinia furnacalis]